MDAALRYIIIAIITYVASMGIYKAVRTRTQAFRRQCCFDSQSSHRQNRYLPGIFLIAVLAIILLAPISCSNRHDLTDNYSVFTYGEGLYGESEQDYPIFASKLGYDDEPPYIPNVRHIWWSDIEIIIEQNDDIWWIITAKDKTLTVGDMYCGPLSRQQKDSIVLVKKMNPGKMKHRNYE